jgi:hypothetical protein
MLRLLWSTTPIPAKRMADKRFAYQWRPLLVTILRAVGNFLRAPKNRRIRDPKEKRKQISHYIEQGPE